MGELRVGLIGCGGMGATVARHCQSVEGARIAAVHDPNDEAAAKLARQFEATKYGSHTQLLNEVDAVIVATPNDLHAPLTIEAAQAGKHIFCEKPMALSVEDCDAMIAAADRAGVKLMVGQVLRLIGPVWKSRAIIASGELGSPFAISVTRVACPDVIKAGWRVDKKQTGGVLYEIHVHELDFMRYVMGEAKSVYASIGHFTTCPVEYEDLAFVQIRYSNGGIGTLHCGLSCSTRTYNMMIQCEKGTLFNEGYVGPITYSRFGEDAICIKPDEIDKEDPYREEVRSWVEAITRGTEMIFDGSDGRAAIELAQAAYRSAETGDVVHLPPRP